MYSLIYLFVCLFFFSMREESSAFHFYDKYNAEVVNEGQGERPEAYSLSCDVIIKNIDGVLSSMVTRVLVIDQNLEVFHEAFVKPLKLSGNDSTEVDLRWESYYQVRTRLVQMLRSQIIVGHKLNYYLRLLQMRHPVYLRRDTAHFSKFRTANDSRRYSLKQLSKKYLDLKVDRFNITLSAVISMQLYLKFRDEWDREMQVRPLIPPLQAYAIFCETVKGKRQDGGSMDMLAKVVVVDSNGATVYQKMITPEGPILDYRSSATNLYPSNFTNTVPINNEREKLAALLRGRVLVGHGLSRDLKLIGLKHPYMLRRDTSTYDRFHRGLAPIHCSTLKDIAEHFLDKTNLQGPQDPANTAMQLYLQYRRDWDLHGKKKAESSKDIQYQGPKRKLITPVAVYYDRILVSTKLGQLKVIGRMVIVNGNYQCIYDRFVKPNNMEVLDCFTENTGIHMDDILQGTSTEDIKKDLVNILRDKILVGYNLKHFLLLLGLRFQIYYRRDLRLYNKFILPHNLKPSISQIAQRFLNVSLTPYTQPVEKARIFMNLYYKYKDDWDIFVAQTYRDLKMVSLNKLIGYSNSSYDNYEPVAMYCSSVTIKNWGLLGYQMLARVTVVDVEGDQVYDQFVKPYSEIVDYRTNETGIHPQQLLHGEEYFKVMEDVIKVISSKIIVGEQLSKCFKLLRHKVDWWLLRDISLFSPFKRLNNHYLNLKEICQKYLNLQLMNESDPLEKARAVMQIYNKFKHLWEVEIKRKHEVLINKAKMFQAFRNEKDVPQYNRSHLLL
uniref:Exonuclease domain-containing protein n=1 Tax=Clastoptera arizonana TaxID=38151 RepID=A0A1B6DAF0_9HEMI